MNDAQLCIIGANGQLGKALQAKYPSAQKADINELDITNRASVFGYDWSGTKVIVNAAAYTNVDGAETVEGRVTSWSVNAQATTYLGEVARQHDLTLVHVSTDYVFDGTKTPHTEEELFSPLSVYGASKAAGDLIVAGLPSHYILRTSWVIGEGNNFVRTMLELGKKGINPSVVDDQIGRLTFTSVLVEAIDHLLSTQAAYGTYNVSGEGKEVSWADVAKEVFQAAQMNNTVTGITTAQYYADKTDVAPRPLQSSLDLSKLKTSGFVPRDWQDDLREYIKKELAA